MDKEMISILCPTRKRTEFMESVVSSASRFAFNREKVEVVFYMDDDDIQSHAKIEDLKERFLNISGIIGPRIVLSQMWNECYKACRGEILMHCGDDIIFKTQDWDRFVREKFDEFDDKIVFVYGSDGIQPDSFGTHGFLHRNWVETVGYFVPPYFSSDFNDTWLNEVSTMIERHVHINIFTEHMHPAVGKGSWDETHLERLSRHKADNVENIYESRAQERISDAKKLKEFIVHHKN